jgi:predicted kinase
VTFLLQMAGLPGSGKSAIAHRVAERTNAIAIDKDLLMAAMMRSGVEGLLAAGAAYEVGFDLARSFLTDGRSVVLDTPANFVAIRDKGCAIARETCADYYIIECVISLRIATDRIALRTPMHDLHPTSLDGVDLGFARPGTAPLVESHLAMDTSRGFDECLREAMEYIGHGQG